MQAVNPGPILRITNLKKWLKPQEGVISELRAKSKL